MLKLILNHKIYTTKLKVLGYSAVEIMLALALVGLITYFSLQYSSSLLSLTKAENTSQQAYNYSQAVVRYITTHQNLLRSLLSDHKESNKMVATISTKILVDEGFIKNDAYFQNNLRQYPCTIVFYDRQQLQAYIYYRTDGNDIKLDQRQIKDGLSHMGAMIGLYQDGKVDGLAGDWQLDRQFVLQNFLKQGTVDISQGLNPGLYACNGTGIANNSYVVNVTSMLTLNNKLPKDDTIHQNQDQLHGVDDEQNNNRINTDLIMDYKSANGSNKNSVIFQMNPDCEMDPNRIETMQDYDPSFDGREERYRNQPNSLGCKNRQLAITAARDSSGNAAMTITGFRQGGYVKFNQNGDDMRPYVGEVRAASLQPTTLLDVGTPCDKTEIGKMARQKRSADEGSVNNIYISQVICMQSPLCEAGTDGICYMPLQTVTIRYSPNSTYFECPQGTFIDVSQIQEVEPNIPGDVRCSLQWCSYTDKQFDHGGDDPFLYSIPLSNSLAQIYRRVDLDFSTWKLWCGRPVHGGCNVDNRQHRNQGRITQIDCTNDPSKASIIIPINS